MEAKDVPKKPVKQLGLSRFRRFNAQWQSSVAKRQEDRPQSGQRLGRISHQQTKLATKPEEAHADEAAQTEEARTEAERKAEVAREAVKSKTIEDAPKAEAALNWSSAKFEPARLKV